VVCIFIARPFYVGPFPNQPYYVPYQAQPKCPCCGRCPGCGHPYKADDWNPYPDWNNWKNFIYEKPVEPWQIEPFIEPIVMKVSGVGLSFFDIDDTEKTEE
jgi:hypothetical protein